MTKWFRLALLAIVFCYVSGAAAWAQPRQEKQPERRQQPGATQQGTTTEYDATPKFNGDYFVGVWKFEGAWSESPLGEGGPISGTEIVTDIWDGRFWDVTIAGKGQDYAPFTGKGVILFQDSFTGQSLTRYELTRGLSVLRTGVVGCDLGGTCTAHFESPPFEHNGSKVQLRGRYQMSGPFSYRMITEISVDGGEYRNLGTIWYTRDPKAPKPHGIK